MYGLTKKNSMKIVSLLLFGAMSSANAGLVVTSNTNANALANTLLGSGVTITNAVYSGDTGSNGSGTFTGGNSAGVGFDSGVLLTTGTVQNAVGPNNSGSTSGSGTFSQLDFDFSFDSGGGSIFFEYVFASEEYDEFVNSSFNDLFSLEVNGTNIALLPGGDEVEIDTVNNGVNSAFYKDNTPAIFDIEYDGLTTVLTASLAGLVGTNHMTFFITDTGDSIYDSGVFIKAKSFSDTPPAVPIPAAAFMFAPALMGFFGLRRKAKAKIA